MLLPLGGAAPRKAVASMNVDAFAAMLPVNVDIPPDAAADAATGVKSSAAVLAGASGTAVNTAELFSVADTIAFAPASTVSWPVWNTAALSEATRMFLRTRSPAAIRALVEPPVPSRMPIAPRGQRAITPFT